MLNLKFYFIDFNFYQCVMGGANDRYDYEKTPQLQCVPLQYLIMEPLNLLKNNFHFRIHYHQS